MLVAYSTDFRVKNNKRKRHTHKGITPCVPVTQFDGQAENFIPFFLDFILSLLSTENYQIMTFRKREKKEKRKTD